MKRHSKKRYLVYVNAFRDGNRHPLLPRPTSQVAAHALAKGASADGKTMLVVDVTKLGMPHLADRAIVAQFKDGKRVLRHW